MRKLAKKKSRKVNTKKKDTIDAEWRRVCSAMTRDSVRISVPRGFLSILTLFFHHVSDAMAGDDRPDHGLAKMRQGREHYRLPFYFICGKLKRAEDKMSEARHRKAVQVFSRYFELLEERDKSFRERIKRRRENAQ